MNRKNTAVNASVILFSVLLHLFLFFFSVNLKDPAELEDIQPAFPMIDAVLIDDPLPVVQVQAPEPQPEPEPEPVPEPVSEVDPVIPEEINDAVVADEEADELPEEEEVSQSAEAPPEPVTERVIEAPPVNYIPFYRLEKRPRFISQAALEYPGQAKRNRIEGTVILEAFLDASGRLIRVKIVKKAGFGFDEAATRMLENSTYSPALMDGRAVAVRMRFTVKFEL